MPGGRGGGGDCLPDARLPRWERLHRQRDFFRLRRLGRRTTGRCMVLVWDPHEDARAMGIAVGRTVGPAVTRSAVRRRFRESYRHLRYALRPVHMLFIARPRSAGVSLREIAQEMEVLCRDADLWLGAD